MGEALNGAQSVTMASHKPAQKQLVIHSDSVGSYSYRQVQTNMVEGDSVDSDPMIIWMDNVECASGRSYFLGAIP